MFSKGLLHIISGPMFSGKTSELIRLYDRSGFAKQKSIIIKPSIDLRYSKEKVSTHNQDMRLCYVLNNINELTTIIEKELPENVFIDEAQFFDSNILDFITNLRNKNINVYCAILNQTSEGNPFPFKDNDKDVGTLMALADNITILTAVCPVCGKFATKTYKRENSGKEVDVGSFDKYEPRCYEHWDPKK